MESTSRGRETRVARLRHALESAAAGSTTVLLGSSATGTADDLSDIDLAWRLGSSPLISAAALRVALGQVGAVSSLRLDPDRADPTPGPGASRLVFVRFDGWSLFWRVDLVVVGPLDDEGSWDPWSTHESALMNVVAAEKARRRGRDDAPDLLRRAYLRIHVPEPRGTLERRMHGVVDAVADADPGLEQLVADVRALIGRTDRHD